MSFRNAATFSGALVTEDDAREIGRQQEAMRNVSSETAIRTGTR